MSVCPEQLAAITGLSQQQKDSQDCQVSYLDFFLLYLEYYTAYMMIQNAMMEITATDGLLL